MADNNTPTTLRYKIDRLDELIEAGENILQGIGRIGNIDQHDLWFAAVHSFLAINGPEFIPQLGSIAEKYANDIQGEHSNRATYHLIQEQIEVLRLARGNYYERLQASPELNAIYAALEDKELRERCLDLLAATGNYDRVVNQATLVLEDRIRQKAGLEGSQGIDLISKAMKSNPNESIIRLSDDKQTQEGISLICRGIILAYRNPTHHKVIEKYPRADALKFCAFIDSLLSIIDNAGR